MLSTRILALLTFASLAGSPAISSDLLAFWQGALSSADRTEPVVMQLAPGRLTFAGPGNAVCQMQTWSATGRPSLPVLHVAENLTSAPTVLGTDSFLHLQMTWLLTAPDPQYSIAGLPDRTQFCLYQSVQCVSRALDVARLQVSTASRKVGIIAEGLGCFAGVALAALRPGDVAFLVLREPTKLRPTPPEPRLQAALQDFDAARFAPLIRCPTLVVYGRSDDSEALVTVYSALTCPKAAVAAIADPLGGVPTADTALSAFAQSAIRSEVAARLADLVAP